MDLKKSKEASSNEEVEFAIRNIQTTDIREITGTPFRSVKLEEGNWTICIGNQQVTQRRYHSHEHAEAEIRKIDWDIVGTFIGIITENIFSKWQQENK